MHRRDRIEVTTERLGDEPAVRAWSSLGRPPPERLELLRHRNKSSIYRLPSVGRAGTDVIAKRCLWEIAIGERAVYELLLRLPGRYLDYYGFVAEPDRSSGWLFVEDAHGEPYAPANPEHRAVAAAWLAGLHTASCRAALASELPERGPAHYLEHLHGARQRIRDGLADPRLDGATRDVLGRILGVFDLVEGRWAEVESRCDVMPRALTHGDFAERNVRIRREGAQASLLAFDWEVAGWGVPAVDLLSVDLAVYGAGVREAWNLDLATLRDLVTLGQLLRGGIAAVSWLSVSLGTSWLEQVRSTMPIYLNRLGRALEGLGWTRG